MNRVVHAWSGCALAVVCLTGAVRAQAQEAPSAVLGVACEGECRERLWQPGARVRVISGELDVMVQGDGARGVSTRTRLITTDGLSWRVAPGVGGSTRPPRPVAPLAMMSTVRASVGSTSRAEVPTESRAPRSFMSGQRAGGVALTMLGVLSVAFGGVAYMQRDRYATTFNTTSAAYDYRYSLGSAQVCTLQDGVVFGGAHCQHAYDETVTWNTVMWTSMVLGGAAIAAGVTLLAWPTRAATPTRMTSLPRWWVGPGPVAAGGSVGASF